MKKFIHQHLVSFGATIVAILIAVGISACGGGGGNDTPPTPTVPTTPQTPTTPVVLKYTDKVYALWTGAYPYTVTKSGVTRVTNATSVPGTAPFFNCWLLEQPLEDGRVLTSCQRVDTLARVVYYINPVEEKLYDYVGEVSTNAVWHAVGYKFDKPGWYTYAHVTDGQYFVPDNAGWVLKFKPNNGDEVTVKAGTFAQDETIRLIMHYSK